MTMELNEKQYQRVARFLDGEALELTPEEHATAVEIRSGLEALDALKQIAPSPGAMAMARKRMMGEVARPRRRALRIACSVAAVAAAVILLAVMVMPPERIEQPVGPQFSILSPERFTEIYVSEGGNPELDFLASQLDELEADVFAPVIAVPVSGSTDSFAPDGDIRWTDEPENWLGEI